MKNNEYGFPVIKTRFTIEEEISEQYGLLLAAEAAYKYAALSVLRIGTGHNNEALDYHTDCKVYKANIAGLENQLNET